MDNQAFLRSIGVSGEAMLHCLTAMEKYGDNHWWEPDVDPRKYAYYQIHEDYLLGKFGHLHDALELLLGREVFTHEIGISIAALRQEAERAWKYQVGVTSEQERQERVQQSIDDLAKWATEHGKQVIKIQQPKQ